MFYLLSILILLITGLLIKPKSFKPAALKSLSEKRIPLAKDLPPPVRAFYQSCFGDTIPVINSAIISGRAKIRLGITFQGRFRFVHSEGKEYRHYIEATFFGLPLFKVNEFFLKGKGRLELPFGVVEGEPKINQAMNLALWAEVLVWIPSMALTTPHVRWEGRDSNSAYLHIPFEGNRETFLVTFSSETAMLCSLEVMRYKEIKDENKTLWLNRVSKWQRGKGYMSEAATKWDDEKSPWAVWFTESVIYNADVEEYIQAYGP